MAWNHENNTTKEFYSSDRLIHLFGCATNNQMVLVTHEINILI